MARRRRGLPVNGVLLLDKPRSVSSNHALQRARRLFQAQKAGHTGTLDPMATGLLPICFGEATKFSSHLLEADKVYRTRVELGTVTDTGDAEGEVVERREVPALGEAGLRETLTHFIGEIEQVPPMHSALKHQGRKLYELAREGKTVERAARRVTVYDARLLACEEAAFEMEVRVSKGTYIRTLAEDIGQALGCGGHISELRRLKTGPFESEGMLSLEALERLIEDAAQDSALLPVDVLVAHLPRRDMSAAGARCLRFGQAATGEAGDLPADSLTRLYHADAFLGLGVVTAAGDIAPRRLLSSAVAGSA
ncbi:tRNA pseudouridine(55) synthase TruB [Halomonas elongata]|uniref:tRNA pseudouridine synthase B n=1 Tax=Halomonas elongata (strain ATCC 33173 / DSM 2581 / NBRC 15536 / NCIMB 2198 / 1H9) TaxID=768066 RepID=E1VAS0_HALED|nr:tRNA pseudouridine(55) synthase TruB [Halomonas elongata]MBW5801815.1 tRNA pseudouridine(55) synthase TruB [Halomonas elongata]MDL4861029.1 tRNA pseudouridine(55) synthase TruB [Halomonas elongata]WBF17772.1 tRNA pseudouridine(55) synthase TruB [Halomonas elongata]WPU46617.1 tRNA pseudouridine(55) synthase TruB [Halomonas elongata DSM 2581]CBV44019.1 tRNA pseudouridine synthase TruB [Halomonas elongata DSM 2581]